MRGATLQVREFIIPRFFLSSRATEYYQRKHTPLLAGTKYIPSGHSVSRVSYNLCNNDSDDSHISAHSKRNTSLLLALFT
jgi:hypothetical protein